MVGYVILVQFAGVFLVFRLIPVFLIPYLEQSFQGRLPTALPNLDAWQSGKQYQASGHDRHAADESADGNMVFSIFFGGGQKLIQ